MLQVYLCNKPPACTVYGHALDTRGQPALVTTWLGSGNTDLERGNATVHIEARCDTCEAKQRVSRYGIWLNTAAQSGIASAFR